MEVTIDLPKAQLVFLRDTLSKLIREQEDVLALLRKNRANIDFAIEPVRTTTVTSSDGLRSYRVTKSYVTGFGPGAATYTCSCPSFQYARGLDDRSRCKHIRQAQEEGL